ncbi:MAG: DUF4294 domain-containing protein [Bacteroidales bacterium]|nr:DUF4294 domain-containing protein [Bacteroidales bacterium]
MNIYFRILFLSFLLCFMSLHVYSQEPKGILTRAIIYEGDTIPLFWLPTVKIYGTRIFKNKTEAIEYTRLVRNVKKVYPLAKLVGTKVNEINAYLNTIPNERVRKKELNRLEKELRDQYQDQVMALTFSQGKILIKLIYRETSRTTYHLIEDYRGSIVAFFWQSFAKLFGYDLKVTYDPNGRDREIENIVILIEDGKL